MRRKNLYSEVIAPSTENVISIINTNNKKVLKVRLFITLFFLVSLTEHFEISLSLRKYDYTHDGI